MVAMVDPLCSSFTLLLVIVGKFSIEPIRKTRKKVENLLTVHFAVTKTKISKNVGRYFDVNEN